MSVRRRAEPACSKCEASRWTGPGGKELCQGCGKKRRYSPYQYRFKVDGITYEGPTRERSLGAALAIEAKLRSKIKEDGKPPILRKSPTLEEFWKTFWLHVDKSQSLAPKTKASYKNGWRLLSKTSITRKRINDIGTADADGLTFPGSGSNANCALRTLRRMLGYACELDYRKDAPVIPLREEAERDAIIDLWLEDMLLAHAAPVLRTVITVMLGCGMRPEEVCRMRWEHIRWGEDAILVPHGKTPNAKRFVPLTSRIKDAIAGQRARMDRNEKRQMREASPWVFASPRSRSGHIQDVHHLWARTIERVRAELAKAPGSRRRIPEGLVLYSCRHTFATHFSSASGGDIVKLERILGHSRKSRRVVDKYLHPSVSDAASIMNRFDSDRRKVVEIGRRA